MSIPTKSIVFFSLAQLAITPNHSKLNKKGKNGSQIDRRNYRKLYIAKRNKQKVDIFTGLAFPVSITKVKKLQKSYAKSIKFLSYKLILHNNPKASITECRGKRDINGEKPNINNCEDPSKEGFKRAQGLVGLLLW